MKKTIVVAILLTGSVNVVAMEHIKERPVLQEASQTAEERLVKISLTDSQNSETTHEVPVRFAKLIGALNDLIEDPALNDAVFPLLKVSLVQWRLIEPQLERVYDITHGAPQAGQLREALMIDFRKLDVKSLIGVICASDYLAIPILLESACEVLKQSAVDKILWEELEVLPGDIRNQIIMNKILMLLGPVPGSELVVCRGHRGAVLSVYVREDGKIFSGSVDDTVRVWDMQGNHLAVCKGHEGSVASVCVTKDGKIVSGSIDKTLRVWDMQGNQLAALCRGPRSAVLSVCITKDGKIISGSYDNRVRVWDIQGNQLAVCLGHETGVNSVCVTQDGKIISGSDDKTVRVWDMQGNQLAICRGHEKGVTSVCVTQDGKIISGSDDKTVRVWDIQGNQLALCSGHEGPVLSVCVTEDGKIVSGSLDETVRVWDMQGNHLAVCKGHEGWVTSVCVTKDGRIVSSSEDSTVRIWDSGLLDRIVCMDEDQARAVWAYVRKFPHGLDKHTCWLEIEKILREDGPVAPANINNNNNE